MADIMVASLLALEAADLTAARRKALQWTVSSSFWLYGQASLGHGQIGKELRHFTEEIKEVATSGVACKTTWLRASARQRYAKSDPSWGRRAVQQSVHDVATVVATQLGALQPHVVTESDAPSGASSTEEGLASSGPTFDTGRRGEGKCLDHGLKVVQQFDICSFGDPCEESTRWADVEDSICSTPVEDAIADRIEAAWDENASTKEVKLAMQLATVFAGTRGGDAHSEFYWHPLPFFAVEEIADVVSTPSKDAKPAGAVTPSLMASRPSGAKVISTTTQPREQRSLPRPPETPVVGDSVTGNFGNGLPFVAKITEFFPEHGEVELILASSGSSLCLPLENGAILDGTGDRVRKLDAMEAADMANAIWLSTKRGGKSRCGKGKR